VRGAIDTRNHNNQGEYVMNNTERTATKQQKSATTKGPASRPETKPSVVKQEVAVPVIEEELQVGKREVNRGGVRVSSRLVETPVEEDVMLREEHVRVQRNPVNRPAQAQDLKAFEGGTVELVELDEEAVVAKKARIIEEVVVSKEVTQRTDTVHETLRHTEVEVQPLHGSDRVGAIAQFEDYDSDFRQHYAAGNYSQHGYAYEHIAPAYRYGYQLGTSEDFRGRDWPDVEQKASAAWEERNPGTWEQVKAAARHAWDKATGRL
jgi:uncharacterized protein (TIGR02271 family)